MRAQLNKIRIFFLSFFCFVVYVLIGFTAFWLQYDVIANMLYAHHEVILSVALPWSYFTMLLSGACNASNPTWVCNSINLVLVGAGFAINVTVIAVLLHGIYRKVTR